MRQRLIYLFFSVLFLQCQMDTNSNKSGIVADPVQQAFREQPETKKETPAPSPEKKQALQSTFIPNMKGQFVYAADAALFFPCGEENAKYPVVMNEAYKVLEAAYTRMPDRAFGEKVYVELIGEMATVEGMEGGKEKSLKIQQMVRMKRDTDCE